ncbi:DUF6686 family protein [Flavicella sp.]|uniref:DUF6686 family protein n=1 Tax=Flavicella sp. TaxID=2957742 RepID=UPI0030180BB0
MMTSDIKILNTTTNGIVSKSRHVDEYHVLFKNHNFSFPLKAYDDFTKYIIDLNNVFEDNYATTDCYCQEISITTANKTIKAQLSYNDLKELFSLSSIKENIMNRIAYSFSLN